MIIYNMQSPCTGNAAANQFVIVKSEGKYYQSYETLIAFMPSSGDTPTVTDSWCCSATTLKYLKKFLGISLSKKDIAKRIEAGSIILDNTLSL